VLGCPDFSEDNYTEYILPISVWVVMLTSDNLQWVCMPATVLKYYTLSVDFDVKTASCDKLKVLLVPDTQVLIFY
jgi:hypothetical protein